jgi:hypothetical protein
LYGSRYVSCPLMGVSSVSENKDRAPKPVQFTTTASCNVVRLAVGRVVLQEFHNLAEVTKHYTVEFENDRVRVLRIKYGPGEKSVMHSPPESIAVFLTDIHAKFTYPDGRTEDINANAGTVQYMDALTHLPESTSKTPFEVIAVELKD